MKTLLPLSVLLLSAAAWAGPVDDSARAQRDVAGVVDRIEATLATPTLAMSPEVDASQQRLYSALEQSWDFERALAVHRRDLARLTAKVTVAGR